MSRKSIAGAVAAGVAAAVVALGAPVQAHQPDAGKQGQKQGQAQRQGEVRGDRSAKHGAAHRHDAAGENRRGPSDARGGDKSRGDERGGGHTPVTVCHVLGNGSYIELTFDSNALAAHQAHGDLYPVPAGGCPTTDGSTAPNNGGEGNGGEGGGEGHTPVTVCHLLGNGSYRLLTFDDDALDAHVGHGDLYPVPAAGCPDEAPVTGDEPEEVLPGQPEVTGPDAADEAPQVLGTERLVSGAGSGTARDAGTVAGVDRVAPVTGPAATALPQTGAVPVALTVLAGLGLLGAGLAMLRRRLS